MINAYVPNIFSPNGDGENDVFRVMGPDFHSFSMMIFNRWGELIYETNDNTTGWDGSWRNKNAGTGVYTYVIEGRAVTGEDVNFGGNVTLVR